MLFVSSPGLTHDCSEMGATRLQITAITSWNNVLQTRLNATLETQTRVGDRLFSDNQTLKFKNGNWGWGQLSVLAGVLLIILDKVAFFFVFRVCYFANFVIAYVRLPCEDCCDTGEFDEQSSAPPCKMHHVLKFYAGCVAIITTF